MNPLAGILSERLSKAQVVDGFETEPWAVCGRLPQAVVFPESEAQIAEILSGIQEVHDSIELYCESGVDLARQTYMACKLLKVDELSASKGSANLHVGSRIC